jgi:hypothetical protein
MLDLDILIAVRRHVDTDNFKPRELWRPTEINHGPDPVEPAERLLVPVKYHRKSPQRRRSRGRAGNRLQCRGGEVVRIPGPSFHSERAVPEARSTIKGNGCGSARQRLLLDVVSVSGYHAGTISCTLSRWSPASQSTRAIHPSASHHRETRSPSQARSANTTSPGTCHENEQNLGRLSSEAASHHLELYA